MLHYFQRERYYHDRSTVWIHSKPLVGLPQLSMRTSTSAVAVYSSEELSQLATPNAKTLLEAHLVLLEQ